MAVTTANVRAVPVRQPVQVDPVPVGRVPQPAPVDPALQLVQVDPVRVHRVPRVLAETAPLPA